MKVDLIYVDPYWDAKIGTISGRGRTIPAALEDLAKELRMAAEETLVDFLSRAKDPA